MLLQLEQQEGIHCERIKTLTCILRLSVPPTKPKGGLERFICTSCLVQRVGPQFNRRDTHTSNVRLVIYLFTYLFGFFTYSLCDIETDLTKAERLRAQWCMHGLHGMYSAWDPVLKRIRSERTISMFTAMTSCSHSEPTHNHVPQCSADHPVCH